MQNLIKRPQWIKCQIIKSIGEQYVYVERVRSCVQSKSSQHYEIILLYFFICPICANVLLHVALRRFAALRINNLLNSVHVHSITSFESYYIQIEFHLPEYKYRYFFIVLYCQQVYSILLHYTTWHIMLPGKTS